MEEIVMNREQPTLYLVVPCYNEEEIVDWSYDKLRVKYDELIGRKVISGDSKIIFVNDGSRDKTREKLEGYCAKDDGLILINFSRNYGHQSAILAGMLYAKNYCDATITIDADLQQDINALESFINEYKKGCDIVYGIRNDRKSDNFFKKSTALLFYKLMKALGSNVIENSADYRLLSKKALETLDTFSESNLFLRGLIPLMGYKSGVVHFDVHSRTAGKSKYTMKKMLNLALDGVTSLSTRPIRFVLDMGIILCLIGIILLIYGLSSGTVQDLGIKASIWLVGGIVLIGQGIIGEYIGKMYFETKKRPRYIIDSIINS